MKRFFSQWIPILMLVVALYFMSDFYQKGRSLNDMLPVPILGWLFWGLLIFAVYYIVLKPICSFIELTHIDATEEDDIWRVGEVVKRQIEKRDGSQSKDWWKIHNIVIVRNPDTEEELRKCISEYYSGLDDSTAKIIQNYSWKAALCVVFSRNPFVDGLLMFFAQYKMALELMEKHGFKPAPLFNVLCFFWIASNSVLNSVFAQASADTVGNILSKFLTEQGLEEGVANKALSRLGSFAVEAMTAATTVYVTGWLLNRKLKGDHRKIEIEDLFTIRKEAKTALLKDVKDEARQKLEKQIEIV